MLACRELRKSIQSLTTLSTTATRRLDITYYNLLQTLSTLVSTISSLQELSSSTTHLQQDFQSEANVLQQDIEGQINAFHGFDTQQTKIERLQGLMQQRRTKVEELGKRLEDVKRRVEKWERREGDWQAMVSRRLKLLWGGIAAVVLVVVILLVLHHLPAKPYEHANHLLQNKTLGMGLMGSPDDTDFTKPSIFAAISKSHITSGSTTENSLRHVASSQSSTDPRLRMFDEL